MIDTHAHIYLKEFRDDLDQIVETCKSTGIKKIYMPNIDSSSIEDMLEVESRYPGYCIPMMGLHPGSVDQDFHRELYIVEEWLGKREFAAVGEIGMDLYWDVSFHEQQKEAFHYQITLAKKHGLPIVIHNRNAFEDAYDIVKNLNENSLRGIFHCFTGTKEESEKIISLDFFLGIGGVVTYKKGGLDKIIPETGIDRIVLETDSPYLAPVPFRGKRNHPSYITYVVEKIAQLKSIDVDEVVKATSINASNIFRL